MARLLLLCLSASLVSLALGHSNILNGRASGGSIGPMGSNSFRMGIPRGDTGVPGPPTNNNCPHCVMENRPTNSQTSGQWYTKNAAAHWDNQNQWPSIPCMSDDSFGRRGTLNVRAGELLNLTMYVNADHGGFYRYELASGQSPSNSQFMAKPISPFYSLHESAETYRSYAGRVVGYSKSDTNGYISNMKSSPGAGLGGNRMNPQFQGSSSSYCNQNPSKCNQMQTKCNKRTKMQTNASNI